MKRQVYTVQTNHKDNELEPEKINQGTNSSQ